MLDYFLSSDWAIIASELLAGFIVLTVVLAVLLWRGQRRHTDAAARLLDDRDPIARASEEMVERQIQRIWPEIQLDEVQRSEYAERSLDAIEALIEPWLEPKRYELSGVARSLLQVRQADLEQVLNLALAQCESKVDEVDPRMGELEKTVAELRQTSDRQAKQLGEALETVNIMVREYGRKFDYDKEPHVSKLLQAIVILDEMDAGADCETARRRAQDLVSEDLVAAPSVHAEDANQGDESGGTEAEEPIVDDAGASQDTTPAETKRPEGSGDDSAQGDQSAEAADTGPEPAGTPTPDEVPSSDDATEAPEQPAQAGGDEDIDDLIAQAQTEPTASSDTESSQEESGIVEPAADESVAMENSGELPQARAEGSQAATDSRAEKSEEESNGGDDEPASSPATSENVGGETREETRAAQDSQAGEKDTETETEEVDLDQPDAQRREDPDDDNSVIDLDEVEIPEEDKAENNAAEESDLDDIDALLDAEIARKHGKDQP